jgi:hypothetical protein
MAIGAAKYSWGLSSASPGRVSLKPTTPVALADFILGAFVLILWDHFQGRMRGWPSFMAMVVGVLACAPAATVISAGRMGGGCDDKVNGDAGSGRVVGNKGDDRLLGDGATTTWTAET